MMIQNDDAALPYFVKLNQRDRMSIMEIANTIKQLVEVLHVTSTPTRPALDGSSNQFMADQLGMSRSLISQYLSIANIRSQTVKSALVISGANLSKAYYI